MLFNFLSSLCNINMRLFRQDKSEGKSVEKKNFFCLYFIYFFTILCEKINKVFGQFFINMQENACKYAF